MKRKAIAASIKTLRILGCTFIVETPDGQVFTNAVEQKPQRKRPPRTAMPRGEIKQHIQRHTNNFEIPVGEVAEIPIPQADGLDHKIMRQNVMVTLHQQWGKGAYKTFVNRERGHIEVLRLS